MPLESPRSMLKIFDSTTRDGQHSIRHQFKKSQISRYASLAEKAKIPVLVVGHGNGLGASSLHLGMARVRDRELLKAAKKNLKKTKLAAFAIPGFAKAASLVFLRFFFAALSNSLSLTLAMPRCKLDAPSPFPCPTTSTGILAFSARDA